MTIDELRESVRGRVNVTRADIVAAKTNLVDRMTSGIEVRAEADRWALMAGGGVPQRVQADSADDTLVGAIASGIVARLATVAAAFELVNIGLAFQVGSNWDEYSPAIGEVWYLGYGGSVSWPDLNVSHPIRIGRPVWYDRPSELFDADLYLSRLPNSLNANVASALRSALACFRRELNLPAIAMLGAASEGAWLEIGDALGRRFSSSVPSAAKLVNLLREPRASIKNQVDGICDLYDRPDCRVVEAIAGVTQGRLREAQRWSEQVREARNVLHWYATTDVPNTYEKAAILLMKAVSELTALQKIRDAC